MLFMSQITFAQNAKIDAFYAKYRHQPNTISMSLPGWLIRFGLSTSGEQKETKEIRPLMQGLNNMRVLVMEEKNHASPKDVNALVAHARSHQFNDLIAIKEADTKVNILLKTKKTKKGEIIRHLLILVSEADELVLVTFNGRWKKEILEKFLQEDEGNFIDSFVKLN